jgi:mevalonate kinase
MSQGESETVVTAPAKIILYGEHAVVYDQPALAVPIFALQARAAIAPADRFTLIASDLDEKLPINIDDSTVSSALALMTRLVLNHFRAAPPPVQITVTSTIPLASGLGSGAAVSTAIGRAMAAALNRQIDHETLNTLVYEVERMHHGTPSGIDNTVIVYGQPVYFVRQQPIERFSVGQPLYLLVADTGLRAPTHVSVGEVRKLYEQDRANTGRIIETIGGLVKQARTALELGDLHRAGQLMDENHVLLQELTVSSDELDRLVDAAKASGALGAKLSGGGRGGNMIALVSPESSKVVAAALLSAGAVRVIETTIT